MATKTGDIDVSISVPPQSDLDKFKDPDLVRGLSKAPEDPGFSRTYANYEHWYARQERLGRLDLDQVQRAIHAHDLYPGDSLARLQHGHFQTGRL